MRAIKSVLAAAIIFSFAAVLNAQTTIRITGSTAFRGATVTAIRNLYTANLLYGYGGGSGAATFGSASFHIFKGDIGANTNVTIKCSWSGAVDGQLAVASGDPAVTYFEDGGTTLNAALTNGGTASLTGTGSGTAGTAAAGVASDVAMLDHIPATTPFVPPTYSQLSVTPVGVIAFKWLVNPGQAASPVTLQVSTTGADNIGTVADTSSLSAGMTIYGNANIPRGSKIGAILSGTTFSIVNVVSGADVTTTNGAQSNVNTNFITPAPISGITSQIAQALYTSGSVPLSMFTGNNADSAQKVWPIGRDAASGTRLQAHQESGVGYNNQVTQFQPKISGNVATHNLRAINSSSVLQPIKDQHPNPGDGGYFSGGNLASAIIARTPNALDVDGLPFALNGSNLPDETVLSGPTAMGYFIGYAGVSDADGAINTGGAKELTWNGVPYSITAVREGKYTFWGYEALAYRTTLSGVKKTIADALAQQIINTDAPDPKLNTMHVLRTSDGGVVLP